MLAGFFSIRGVPMLLRMLTLFWLGIVGAVAIAQVTTAPATKPARPAAPAAKQELSLDDVVAKLTAETEKLIEDGTPFVVRRPHPVVDQLAKDSALKVLDRLPATFTGDPVKDTY